mmetsp:Transcript_72734/g.194084  ORF Transcript_72734/g.194084 Transcript_72734/m.194084 type:complete len:208 (+) Transcript_72734:248-871(+)
MASPESPPLPFLSLRRSALLIPDRCPLGSDVATDEISAALPSPPSSSSSSADAVPLPSTACCASPLCGGASAFAGASSFATGDTDGAGAFGVASFRAFNAPCSARVSLAFNLAASATASIRSSSPARWTRSSVEPMPAAEKTPRCPARPIVASQSRTAATSSDIVVDSLRAAPFTRGAGSNSSSAGATRGGFAFPAAVSSAASSWAS